MHEKLVESNDSGIKADIYDGRTAVEATGAAVLAAVKTTQTDSADSDGNKEKATLTPSLSATGNEIEKIKPLIIDTQSAKRPELESQTVVTPEAMESNESNAKSEPARPVLDTIITDDTTPHVVHSETTTNSTVKLRSTIDDNHTCDFI